MRDGGWPGPILVMILAITLRITLTSSTGSAIRASAGAGGTQCFHRALCACQAQGRWSVERQRRCNVVAAWEGTP